MSGKPITVGVIGGTIWGNRGAEAMVATTIGKIRHRWPAADFKVFSYYPKEDSRLIDDDRIEVFDARPMALVFKHFPFALLCFFFNAFQVRLPKALLTREISALRSCDVLLDIPGIAFADGREKYLPFNILTIWPAMLLGVPVVKLAQALGPFRNPINRLLARRFLPRCTGVFARGPATARHLQSLEGIEINWHLSADTAFLFETRFSFTNENQRRVLEAEGRLSEVRASSDTVLAICPSSLVLSRSLRAGLDYIGTLAQVIIGFSGSDSEAAFLIFPNATREGFSGLRNNDIVVVDELRKRVNRGLRQTDANRIVWVDFDINSASIAKLLPFSDVLITSRFHAMIAGLRLSLPTLVLGWGHKYREVLSQFELGQYSFSFSEDRLNLAYQIRTILENRDSVREAIQRELETVCTLSQDQFDQLEDLLR